MPEDSSLDRSVVEAMVSNAALRSKAMMPMMSPVDLASTQSV